MIGSQTKRAVVRDALEKEFRAGLFECHALLQPGKGARERWERPSYGSARTRTRTHAKTLTNHKENDYERTEKYF